MRKRIVILMISFHLFISCKTKGTLLLPVESGIIVNFEDVNKMSTEVIPQIIRARNDYFIKSCENGIVENVLMIGNNYVVVIDGKYNIWYSNLSTCNIKRGDKILRGAIIGTMPKSGYENANAYLDLIIKKGEYYYSAKYFWKK